MNVLSDKEIYAISSENIRYNECVHCLCRMCKNLRENCKTCALCLFECLLMRKCLCFVPYVFGSEPYKSYFRELERLRGAKYDVIGFFE